MASEAAWTLAELASEDAPALVTACRRLLEAHATLGPMWWVAARMVVATDPFEAARQATEELCSDSTSQMVASRLMRDVEPGAAVAITLPAPATVHALGLAGTRAVRLVASRRPRRVELRRVSSLPESARGFAFEDADLAVEGAALLVVEAAIAGPAGVGVDPEAAVVVNAAGAHSVPVWAVVAAGGSLPESLFVEAVRRSGDRLEVIAPEIFELAIGPLGADSPPELFATSNCPSAPELVRRST